MKKQRSLPTNIFKETFIDRATGERREAKKYSVRFLDINGLAHTLAIDTNLSVTKDILRNIERLRSLKLNNEIPSTDLMRWLESAPVK